MTDGGRVRSIKVAVVLAAAAIALLVPTGQAVAEGYGSSGSATSASTTVGTPVDMRFTYPDLDVVPPGSDAYAQSDDALVFAVIRASAHTYRVDQGGTVTINVTPHRAGIFTITLTANGVILVGTLTAAPVDGGSISATGFDIPVVLAGAGAGVVLIGVAVLLLVRRRRAAAPEMRAER